jgi:lipoprotein-anchoring transpeptidase ErfK/SrfK
MTTVKPARLFAPLVALSLVSLFGACGRVSSGASPGGDSAAPAAKAATDAARGPSIEASPVEKGEGGYEFFDSDKATLAVRAPGASEVKILYRPVASDEQFTELATLTRPANPATGEFRAELQPPPDFNGEVWAQADYPDGSEKESEHVALASKDEAAGSTPKPDGQATTQAPAVGGQTVNSDESSRSDSVTGGHVEQAAFKPGDGNISVSVNVPAFLLTLWQDGKQVALYHVGVGQKKYPIKIGERQATEVILNPTWIPPNSKWVRARLVGEHITAADPRNPLGKIKIPLGDAYLIHQAESPSDIGHLVSHGCVRVLKGDLFDLAEKIAQARGVADSAREIEQAEQNTKRRIIRLGDPVPVDINYDTTVVEGGVLHIYPDVYDRGTNTVERLRGVLQRAGVDASKLGDGVLREMLGRVSSGEQFVVSVADIESGHALDRGHTEPLAPRAAKAKGRKTGAEKRRKGRID